MIAFYKIVSAMKRIHREQDLSVSSDTRISKQSMKSTLQVYSKQRRWIFEEHEVKLKNFLWLDVVLPTF